MKYQLNEKPTYSVVPVVELMPGEEGVINHVGIYDYGSVIHKTRPTIDGIVTVHTASGALSVVKPQLLAEFDEHDLMIFVNGYGLPLDELKEVRDLEREYRNSASDSSE